jgi:hypothetical protein
MVPLPTVARWRPAQKGDAAAARLLAVGHGGTACAGAMVVVATRGAGRWRRGGLAAVARRRSRLGQMWA